ncbi:hypothetical protein FOZ62_028750, partial [Perkinsus olseni]
IVYISNVFVDPDLRNKRIASTMLPKALKDIRVKWPKVIAAYLIVEIEKKFAVKLYYGLNFTVVAEPTNGRTFVAVDPTAERGKAVVGYVDSKKEYVPSVLAALPEKTRLDSIVYISYVFVHPNLRNKRIASTMLPKALKDVSIVEAFQSPSSGGVLRMG